MRLEATTLEVPATATGIDASRDVAIRVDGAVPDVIYFTISSTYRGIALANITGSVLNSMYISMRFRPAGAMPNGTYSDTITVEACLDQQCQQPVAGSPFHLTTMLNVSGSAAVSAPTVMSRPSTPPLPHDVVDAEISKPLNAIVMVSSWPTNALYVYDLASKTEKKLDLVKAPTAVSISPDGSKAAVGHDALITHVSLAEVGQVAPASYKLLDVAARVYDLVLDGSGVVHVFPAADQWVDLHSVDVATNTDRSSSAFLYEQTRARLHPAGDAMYLLDTRLSPQNLKKYSLTAGVATHLFDAPYWGDYPMCGNLWLSEDGTRIYTGCGNTFRSAALQSEDMLYAGKLPITPADGGFYPSIVSLSQQASSKEIALLDGPACSMGATDCDTLVRLVDSDFYAPIAAYWLPPVPTPHAFRSQHGMFIFHAADGGKFIITRLVGSDDKANEFYLSSMADLTR